MDHNDETKATLQAQQPIPYGMQGLVAQQPPAQNWMPIPQVSGCPPGLEYLTQLDQVLIHQQIELLEVITDFETQNRYMLKNSLGQQCYYAHEESDLCMRLCCKNARGFVMHIDDNTGKEVIRLTREFKCCAGCCWCANTDHCAFMVNVESPVGNPIGQIRQDHYLWTPYFNILDANGEQIFKIKGPCCICTGPCCPNDVPFDIHPKDTSNPPIGRIAKQYGGFLREAYTKATNFSVSFPMDLDVKMKAVLIGATFLFDMMYFEQQKNNNG
ncbi:phospholipid scramblase 1-like isoform X2 [Clavelina lepadiformis]|uniref:Phospholipid scramblase n=1 Tax=Clavelina lepadiformis TaxID=159417 RepID=A0ABP0F472_CLALP